MFNAQMTCKEFNMITTPTDYAANLAFFLLEKTGSVSGAWQGRMTAADQRKLFGQFLGKGLIVIDGRTEQVQHIVKVCFGLDWDVKHSLKWNRLGV
jgi:hypothetical protein